MGKFSFWGWDDGSSILFWSRPKDIRHECRDGCKLYVKVNLPSFTKKQRMYVDKLEFDMVKKKIEKVLNRHEIASGTFLSLKIFFHIPKGEINTRLVYDLTTCGLNEALRDPKLCMTYVENILDTSNHSYWFGDVDTAEMFDTYKMSEKAQPYAGVDFYWTKKGKALMWEQWTSIAMGILSSPFATTMMFVWGMEVIISDFGKMRLILSIGIQ